MGKTTQPPNLHTKKPITGKGVVDKTPQGHKTPTPRLGKTGKDTGGK